MNCKNCKYRLDYTDNHDWGTCENDKVDLMFEIEDKDKEFISLKAGRINKGFGCIYFIKRSKAK